MIHTTKIQEVGAKVGLCVDPFDIHIMNKSDVPLYSDDSEALVEETV